jgi:DNA-binding MarR family transcriptional regulator
VHTRADRLEFAGAAAEKCFVFARDSRDGSLYYLANTPVSAEVRQITREHLRCPIPECPNPRVTVVDRGPGRRNGFSHLGGAGGHAGLSTEHVQAQLMLLDWLRRTRPECTATLEWRLEDGSRVADLMVQFPDGRQVAIEVQYSAQPVSKWRQRHKSYVDRDVRDVWLLGNRPPHLIDAGQQRVELTDMHRAVLQAGLPLLWVNPDRRIATATVTSSGFTLAPAAGAYDVVYRADPIEDCRFTTEGLITPTMELIAEQRTKWEVHQTAQLRSQEAAQAAAANTRQRRQASVEAAQGHRAVHEATWATSPLRAELLAKHGQLPAPITDSPRPDNGVFAAPQHWHAIICRDLLHDRVGGEFTVGDVYRALADQQIELHPHGRTRSATIAAYLDRLHQRGLIRIERDPADPTWIRHCIVRMDLDEYGRLLKAERERSRIALAEQRAMAKIEAGAEAGRRASEAAARSQWDYPLPEHDGNIGRVRHFVPDTDPVLRWHQIVISAIRDKDGQHTPAYPADVRRALTVQLRSVPEDDLRAFLAAYRTSVGLGRESPGG